MGRRTVEALTIRVKQLFLLACCVQQVTMPPESVINEFSRAFATYWLERTSKHDPFMHFNQGLLFEYVLRECIDDIFEEPYRHENWIQNKARIYFSLDEIAFISENLF
jgi:hypothetical protein